MAVNRSAETVERLEEVGSDSIIYTKTGSGAEVALGTLRAQGDLVLHDLSANNEAGYMLNANGRIVVQEG